MASENWAIASDVTCAMQGIREFVELKYNEDAEKIEVTNMASPKTAAGKIQYQGTHGMITTTVTGKFVVNKDTPIVIVTGSNITGVAFTLPDGRSPAGTIGIDTQSASGGPKGGYFIDFTGTFTGNVTGR